MVLDRELRYVAANAAYRRATATDLDALLGRTFYEVFPHDPSNLNNASVALVRASLERVLRDGEPDVIASVVYRVPEHTPEGVITTDRVWSATHTPLRDDSGAVTHVLQHTVDITEVHRLRASAEIARGESEPSDAVTADVMRRADSLQEKYTLLSGELGELRRLFDQTPGFVCFLRGPTHVFELANPAYYQLVGHRELIGRRAREALSDIEGQGFFELLDRAFETSTALSERNMRAVLRPSPGAEPLERFVDFVFQPIVDGAGRSVGIFVSGHDVTDLQDISRAERAAQASARAARAEQRFLADLLPVQVWTSDAAGALTYVSRRVEDYFGVSAAQIIGEGWKNVVHPEDLPTVVERWTHSLQTGEPYEVEFRLARADQSYRWHLGRAVALRDDEGQITKWYGTNADIDDQRAALAERAALVDALVRKNEELDRFAHVASHDLKAPLRAISNLSQWIASDLGDAVPAETQEHLQQLTQRAQSMSELVDAFLQVAKAGLAQEALSEVDTRAVCLHTVELIEPGPSVQVRIAEDLPVIHASRTALSQVFTNLVNNAITHAGSDELLVSIDAERIESGHRFHVRDDGRGIPAAKRAQMWDAFRSVRGPTSGTGLGLAIVKRTVEAHGGELEVSETPGGGATFSFTWPDASSSA